MSSDLLSTTAPAPAPAESAIDAPPLITTPCDSLTSEPSSQPGAPSSPDAIGPPPSTEATAILAALEQVREAASRLAACAASGDATAGAGLSTAIERIMGDVQQLTEGVSRAASDRPSLIGAQEQSLAPANMPPATPAEPQAPQAPQPDAALAPVAAVADVPALQPAVQPEAGPEAPDAAAANESVGAPEAEAGTGVPDAPGALAEPTQSAPPADTTTAAPNATVMPDATPVTQTPDADPASAELAAPAEQPESQRPQQDSSTPAPLAESPAVAPSPVDAGGKLRNALISEDEVQAALLQDERSGALEEVASLEEGGDAGAAPATEVKASSKKKPQFKMGKKPAAVAAPLDLPAETDAGDAALADAEAAVAEVVDRACTDIDGPPRVSLLRCAARSLDGAMDALNWPFRFLPRWLTNGIGLVSLTTVLMAGSAYFAFPMVFPHRDGITYLEEKIAALKAGTLLKKHDDDHAAAGDAAHGKADDAHAPAKDDAHGEKKKDKKDAGHAADSHGKKSDAGHGAKSGHAGKSGKGAKSSAKESHGPAKPH